MIRHANRIIVKVRNRLATAPIDRDRGDVPGWVMITLMTAVIVVLIWGHASKQLTDLLDNAFGKVTSRRVSSQRWRVGCSRLCAGVADSGPTLCRNSPGWALPSMYAILSLRARRKARGTPLPKTSCKLGMRRSRTRPANAPHHA